MSSPPLRLLQRTAAYAVVRDAGSVLLVRASPRSDLAGRWFLPGGGVRHGEHPRDAVLRELVEETGLVGARPRPVRAASDVIDLPHRGVRVHTLRLVYDVQVRSPLRLRAEVDGTSDEARFVPTADLPRFPLMPYVAELFAVPTGKTVRASEPVDPLPLLDGSPVEGAPPGVVAGGTVAGGTVAGGTPEVAHVVQRPAAYAVLIARGRILLAHVSGSSGVWTLPGGGIDFGEDPVAGLVREVYEETGLPLTPGPLLDVMSRHFTGRAPSGRLEDFHGISILFNGEVPLDVEPHVTEVDGSTDRVAWHPLERLGEIHAVASVHESVRRWNQRSRPA